MPTKNPDQTPLSPTRKHIIIVLRLIVFSIIYLIAFQEQGLADFPLVVWFIAIVFSVSELVYLFEHHTHFFIQRILGWIFLFDTALITLLIYFLAIKAVPLSIAYFAVIAIAAMSKSVGMAFFVSIIVSIFYLFISMQQGEFVFTEFITRPLFFFGTAIFAGYLAEEVSIQGKRMEKELQAKEKSLHDFFNNAHDLIQSVSPEGRLLYVNHAWQKTLGYTAEEIPRLSMFDVIHPDYRTHCMTLLGQVFTGESIDDLEVVFVTKDGRDIILQGNVRCYFEDGRPFACQGIFRDITEHKKAEEALQKSEQLLTNVINTAREAVISISEHGLITIFNPAAEKMFGRTKDEISGQQLDSLMPESYRPAHREYIKSYFATGKPDKAIGQTLELPGLRSDGTVFPMEISLASGRMGQEKFVLAVARDITERKHKEEELKKAYEQVKQTQQELIQSEKLAALGTFSSGIAHELKNPLGIILGGSEFLETKLADADANTQNILSKIKKSVLRADKIIHNLLKFAMPSEFEVETVKPNDLINDTLSLLKYRTSLSGVKITTQFASEDLYISVDESHIQQVIFNLLNNAVEAMPQGGQIKIKTYKTEPDEASPEPPACVIEIRDTGEGIAPEDLSRIFDAFFTTKRERKGTGLGLGMAKTIVANHKGNLVIDSELGRGTTAKIILPLV